MSYVEKGKIKVILSNIVVNEMSKHIQDKAYEIAAKMNNLQKDIKKNYAENLVVNVGMEYLLVKVNRKELAGRAISNLKEFLSKLKPEILDTSAVNVEKIFEDYFAFRPPFENNDKKSVGESELPGRYPLPKYPDISSPKADPACCFPIIPCAGL